jgi:hypothetical protein
MFVLGNGESRKRIDINSLHGIKIACNAICRDSFVDHLVCVDRRMVDEAYNFYQSNFNKLYTRQEWLVSRSHMQNLYAVPDIPYQPIKRADEPFQWGSGPYALLVAATFNFKDIKMIGFDLHGTNDKVNNLYKNTKHYDNGNKSAVDPSYWIHQIAKVFECFPKTQFTVYNNEGWELPDSWKLSNVSLDNLSNLIYNK